MKAKERGKLSDMGKIFWRHPGHLIWIFFAYLPFLWEYGIPLTGDQKTYIAIAMEMREKGEWLKPLLFGESVYLKPPFQYWMTLISWKVLGFNLFATFLPSVLALVGTAWCLSEIASHLGERRWYVNSGLWFAATVGAMTYGTTAQMDIYICLFYSAAWWCGVRFLSDEYEKRNHAWLYAACGLAGFSSLVKSPLYSVFWVSSFWIYILIAGEWLLLKSKHLYLSLLFGILIALPWFITILIVDGEHFWAQYIVGEQLNKQGGNGGTLSNLWVPLLYMAFPFTLLSFTAIRSFFLRRRTNTMMTFFIAWCLPPALFFSLYPYRTSVYLFILVPALAILVDWGCFRSNRTKTFLWASRMTGIALFLALSIAAVLLFRTEFIPVWLALAIVFTGSAAVVVTWMGWMRIFALCSLIAILFFRIGAVELARTDIDGLHDAMNRQRTFPSEVIGEIGMLDESRNIWHEIGLLSVTLKHPMKRLYGLDDCVELLKRGGVLILSDEEYSNYVMTLKDHVQSVGKELETVSWKRFKRRKKLPIKEIILEGKSGIPQLDEILSRTFQVVRIKNILTQ
jgi:4-amino-4-deoxy-L-arabinose transferase-like glycosyltransferase